MAEIIDFVILVVGLLAGKVSPHVSPHGKKKAPASGQYRRRRSTSSRRPAMQSENTF